VKVRTGIIQTHKKKTAESSAKGSGLPSLIIIFVTASAAAMFRYMRTGVSGWRRASLYSALFLGCRNGVPIGKSGEIRLGQGPNGIARVRSNTPSSSE